MREATVAAGIVRGLLSFAASRGAGRQSLLDRAGIDPDILSDQDNRIPLLKYIALMDAGRELTGDPALALHFGEAFSIRELSIVGHVSQSGETVDEACTQINRYAPLLVDAGNDASRDRFRIRRTGDGIWFELIGDVYSEYPELAESAFARSASYLAREFGRKPLLKKVRFAHEAPHYRNDYDRIFRVPIEFGSIRNALLVDEKILSFQLPPADRYVSGILKAHADRLLDDLEYSPTVRGKVEGLIIPLLHTGELSMERIAKEMGLSRQTLYRKLKAEGVRYEQLLDTVRHRMALRYLDRQKLSVNETAHLLGFSDPSAFSRAFKRWTGKSPRPGCSHTGR